MVEQEDAPEVDVEDEAIAVMEEMKARDEDDVKMHEGDMGEGIGEAEGNKDPSDGGDEGREADVI